MARINAQDAAVHYFGRDFRDCLNGMERLGYRPGYLVRSGVKVWDHYAAKSVKPPKLKKGETCERQESGGEIVFAVFTDSGKSFVELGRQYYGPKTAIQSEREETMGEWYVTFGV